LPSRPMPRQTALALRIMEVSRCGNHSAFCSSAVSDFMSSAAVPVRIIGAP
jgi:hypothetical protein